jgi:hypothetical protein
LAAKHLVDIEGELAIEIMQVGPTGVQGKVQRGSRIGLRGRQAHATASSIATHTVTPTEAVEANVLIRSSAGTGLGLIDVSVIYRTS